MRRVTVTLPDEVVEEIDRHDTNRSRFLLEAARRELAERRRLALQRSLASPHPESGRVSDLGMAEWGRAGSSEDEDLLETTSGTPVRWQPGVGWTEVSE